MREVHVFRARSIDGNRQQVAVVATRILVQTVYVGKKFATEDVLAKASAVACRKLAAEASMADDLVTAINELRSAALKAALRPADCDDIRYAADKALKLVHPDEPPADTKTHDVYDEVRVLRFVGGGVLLSTDEMKKDRSFRSVRVTWDVQSESPQTVFPAQKCAQKKGGK